MFGSQRQGIWKGPVYLVICTKFKVLTTDHPPPRKPSPCSVQQYTSAGLACHGLPGSTSMEFVTLWQICPVRGPTAYKTRAAPPSWPFLFHT